MARREVRYWSRLGEAVEGMVGGAPCWARADRAMRTGAAKKTVRDGMAGMLSRRFIRPVRGRFGCTTGALPLYTGAARAEASSVEDIHTISTCATKCDVGSKMPLSTARSPGLKSRLA